VWRTARVEALLSDDDAELVDVCEGDLLRAQDRTQLLRRALRVTVERQVASASRSDRSTASRPGRPLPPRRRVPDPAGDDADPHMMG
jgi:hypothetical protein